MITTPPARVFATVCCLLAVLSLALQYHVLLSTGIAAGPAQAVWRLSGFFTILTNCWVALAMGWVALGGRLGAVAAAALTLSIVMVGIVYHLLLAALWSPQGLAWWADQGLHSAVPAAVALWWWRHAERRGLDLSRLPVLVAWPVAYSAYALLRGATTGWFPYPFLDANALGWGAVAVNVGGLALTFAALGAVLVGLARLRGD
jgi:hypothetical protein